MVKKVFAGIGIALLTLWAALAIYYSNLPGEWLRGLAAALFVVGTIVVCWRVRPWRRAAGVFLGGWVAVLIWWELIPASNDRDWLPEVAVLPTATITGDKVTIRNIRNFDYRTVKDFTPRYYDKTFDLSQLDSVDLICAYWGSDAIAHVMVSFGFGGKDYVCFSIERRVERGEPSTTLRGIFRQYELAYVVGDERDLIRVRTNYRQPNNELYLYRARIPVENQRALFLDYVRALNQLAERPQWYNTLTDNCTTGVLLHTRAYEGRARYNWKILLSGYTAEYAYEIGGLDNTLSFAELKQRAHVNERARAADQAADFSQRIRAGVPMPAPYRLEEFRGKS